ncbi:MAG TPA: translation initiation factor IF-2 N-terminal domain-containing protein, partial [Acidimicrobiia bacterium]|nr:translation initiation factor IF-2 N-terminal domain-containing protein [Acidimicrobiia bacterium]
MRAYELARELGVESREVLARAADLGIKISSASSGVDEDTAALIRLAFEEVAAAETAPEVAPAPPPSPPVEVPTLPVLGVRPGVTATGLAEAMGRPAAEVVKV